MKIHALQADITKLQVDAIVNAANSSLLGGGGVDGAVHRAAGPDLVHECRILGGCKTGQAKLTKGYRLPASYIIHTVGPVWQDGTHGEPDLLASCYINCMKIAATKKLSSIAFPSISTGIYRYPARQAACIAIEQVRSFSEPSQLKEVIFCCYSAQDFSLYSELLTIH
jgi:O-acetyl-ADP-ribose deacetylase